MPKDKSIAISIGRKITKDYNSTDVRLAIECTLEEGDSTEEVIQQTTGRLKDQLRAAFAQLQGKAGGGGTTGFPPKEAGRISAGTRIAAVGGTEGESNAG